MKITSIRSKLNKLNIKTTVNVRPMMTRGDDVRIRGYVVELVATDGHYDVSVNAHVMNSEINHEIVLTQGDIATQAINVATTDNIAVKRSNDESDPMSDYCAWSFYRSVKSLEYVFAKAVA